MLRWFKTMLRGYWPRRPLRLEPVLVRRLAPNVIDLARVRAARR